MRKVGIKNRSRRKPSSSSSSSSHQQPPSTSADQYGNRRRSSSSYNSSDNSRHGQQQGEQREYQQGVNDGRSRRQTGDELALSSKNHRLAKELSDLRVRHREETRAVTRLTMENMNLAARVREAMSHVAMLKREVTIYHQKTAELILMQQRQHRISPSSPRPVQTTKGPYEKETSTRLIKTQMSNKPQNLVPAKEKRHKDSSKKSHHVHGSATFSYDEGSHHSNEINTETTKKDRDIGSENRSQHSRKREQAFQHQPFQSNSSQEQIDTPQDSSRNQALQTEQQHQEQLNQSPPDGGMIQVENDSASMFDASFPTSFPDSFSTPKGDPLSMMKEFEQSAFPDPFFADESSVAKQPTKKSGDNLFHTEEGKKSKGSVTSAGSRKVHSSQGGFITPAQTKESVNGSFFRESVVTKFAQLSLTTNGSDEFENERVRTPPFDPDTMHRHASEYHTEKSPSRPVKKLGTQIARAQYLVAMRDRDDSANESDKPPPELPISPSHHSPTVVLKRLHQRRAMDKISKAEKPLAFSRSSSDGELDASDDEDVDESRAPSPTAFLDHSPSDASKKSRISLSSIGEDDAKEEDASDRGSTFDKNKKTPVRANGSSSSQGSNPGNGAGIENWPNQSQPSIASSFKRMTDKTSEKSKSTSAWSRNSKHRSSPGAILPSMDEESRRLDDMATSSSPPKTNVLTASMQPRHRGGKEEDIRRSDSIAGNGSQTSDTNPSSSSIHPRRRNVRQPVSYAEPSLNAKLRRGDVFFPTKDPDAIQVGLSRSESSAQSSLDSAYQKQAAASWRRTAKASLTQKRQDYSRSQHQISVLESSMMTKESGVQL